MSSEVSFSELALTIPELKRKIAQHKKSYDTFSKMLPQYAIVASLVAIGIKLDDDDLGLARKYLDIVCGMEADRVAVPKFEKRLNELRTKQQVEINRAYQTHKDFITNVLNKKRPADAPVDAPDPKHQRTQ